MVHATAHLTLIDAPSIQPTPEVGTHLRVYKTGASLSGATVTLYSRANSTKPWVKVISRLASSTGLASYTVKPSATTQYKWHFAGTRKCGKSTSATETITVY